MQGQVAQMTDLLLFFCRICILGLAFLIAFVTQMQAAFTRNFHYEMKEDLPVWFDWVLIVTGESNAHTCLTAILLRHAMSYSSSLKCAKLMSSTDQQTKNCWSQVSVSRTVDAELRHMLHCHCHFCCDCSGWLQATLGFWAGLECFCLLQS